MTATHAFRAAALAASMLLLAGCSTAAADPGPASSQPLVSAVSAATQAPAVSYTDPAVAPTTWPAEADGYQFSQVPVGPEEQWLAENWPDLWAQGVRAVTTTTWTVPNAFPAPPGDKGTPGALVEYVGGVKYVGTVDLPLCLQPGVKDASVFSSANTDAVIASAKNPSAPLDGVAVGYNSYTVIINEHDPLFARAGDKRQSDYPPSVTIGEGGHVLGSVLTFETKDEAITYVMGGVKPRIDGKSRAINPGEVSQLGLLSNDGKGHTSVQVYDSRAGGWVRVA